MFSLKSLLFSVLVAALFVVAFLKGSALWANIIVTLTIVLGASALIAAYLFPGKRTFLTCAIIMGVAYGSVALIRPLGLSGSLITTRLLVEWWNVTRETDVLTDLRDTPLVYLQRETVPWLLTDDTPTVYPYLRLEVILALKSFQQIGHCAVALVLAVVAGLVGTYVTRRRDLARPKDV